jgi:hypothetical protein
MTKHPARRPDIIRIDGAASMAPFPAPRARQGASMRRLPILASVLAAAAIAAASPAFAYGVYCANGKIEIDSRSFEQMRIARGSGVCAFGQFNYLSDAQNFARRNNFRAGASCSCR